MDEFLEYVLRHLVEFPDEMVLTRIDGSKKITFRLRLRQSDVGRVIGRQGHTIKAIRNLLNTAASRNGQRAVIEIVEERPAA